LCFVLPALFKVETMVLLPFVSLAFVSLIAASR
jgi:hypothetical protein